MLLEAIAQCDLNDKSSTAQFVEELWRGEGSSSSR
jgi:hypothetical protein